MPRGSSCATRPSGSSSGWSRTRPRSRTKPGRPASGRVRPNDARGGSAADPAAAAGRLRGIVLWGEAGQAPLPQPRLQLHLIGLPGTPTKGLRHTLRSDQYGHFEFKRVAPGPYKLTNVIAGRPKWRLKVVVDTGRDVALDLTPENGLGVRDDFRDGS